MRRTNLVELKSGVNKIEFTSDDFPVANSKTPIAILPEGTKIIEAFFNVKIPLKSGNIVGQTNPNSSIISNIMLGNKTNNQEYLTYYPCSDSGKTTSNSGDYFSSPVSYDTNIEIVLENWLSPRVWTIGGDMLVARYALTGFGSQTAAVNVAGVKVAAPVYSNNTETYNGSTWSTSGSLSQYRHSCGGCGTRTAGLVVSGNWSGVITSCEEFNGSTWGAGGAVNVAVQNNKCCGTQNSALTHGGTAESSSTKYARTEEYNGASWTYTTDSNTVRASHECCGSQSSSLIFGGSDGSNLTSSELYNGSAWEIVNSMNVARSNLAGFGLSNSAVSAHEITEEYDGISWSVANTQNNGVVYGAGAGSQNSGLRCGGLKSDYLNETEEYNSVDMSKISMSGNLILNLTVI